MPHTPTAGCSTHAYWNINVQQQHTRCYLLLARSHILLADGSNFLYMLTKLFLVHTHKQLRSSVTAGQSFHITIASSGDTQSIMTAESITCKAAVCWESGAKLVLEDVTVGAPAKGEVRLKVIASGVCHTGDACCIHLIIMHPQTQNLQALIRHQISRVQKAHVLFDVLQLAASTFLEIDSEVTL
jgi:hypothetical protein